MATVKFSFTLKNYEIEMAHSNDSANDLLNQLDVLLKGIEAKGGRPLGQEEDNVVVACSHMAAIMTDGTVYWKVFSEVGTPYSKFGVSIWKEVLEKLGYGPVEKMNPTTRYELAGKSMVVQLGPSKDDPSKLAPKRVLDIR